MFIPFVAVVSISAAFAMLGALMVKVSMLTLALQAMCVVAFAAVLLAAWTQFTGRIR